MQTVHQVILGQRTRPKAVNGCMDGNSAHVIVLGNEKGGSGKSTVAFHLAVSLLYQGYRVATIDVDSRQQTLTTSVRNRRNWSARQHLRVPHTTHYHLPMARGDSVAERQTFEFEMFREAVNDVERQADFIVVDTPGFDTHLTRLAHSLADTLVTPLNDSLIDVDVLARIDPETGELRELGHYTRLVQRARRERLAIDGRTIDWVLVRNRNAMLASRNAQSVQTSLERIARRVGCRVTEGISERVVFRALFPIGMTVFDALPGALPGAASASSQAGARQEYQALLAALNLPAMIASTARAGASGSGEEVPDLSTAALRS